MHRGFALQCFSLKCCCLFSDFSSLTSRYLYCVWDHWYRNWTPVVWRKSLQGVQGLSFFSPVRSWTWPVLPLWYTIHTWLCVHSHVTQVFTCNIVILTLGAHAQQGLQYFVCLSVCRSVCVSMLILAQGLHFRAFHFFCRIHSWSAHTCLTRMELRWAFRFLPIL